MAGYKFTSLDGCPFNLAYSSGRYKARKAGWPVPYRFIGSLPRSLWSFIDQSAGPDSCWPWKGWKRYGYGLLRRDGRMQMAHRLVWRDVYGEPIPAVVMHTCDNPPCCNPTHLRAGTNTDNMRDAIQKGRHCHGERHFNAKITAEIAASILASDETSTVLGARYGVNPSVIRKVRLGSSWRHVRRSS